MFVSSPARCFAILLLSLCLLTGCRTPWWGKKSTSQDEPNVAVDGDDDSSRWAGGNLRSPGPQGELLGLDPQARDIERSLGYR